MTTWRVLRHDDDIEPEANDLATWREQIRPFQTDHNFLGAAATQEFGRTYGTGSFMLLDAENGYMPRLEITIAARQEFYEVPAEEPDALARTETALKAAIEPS